MGDSQPRFRTFCSYTVGGGSVSSHPATPIPQQNSHPHPHQNATRPHQNSSHPHQNATNSHQNMSRSHQNAVHPHQNAAHPHQNSIHPPQNTTHSHPNSTHPHQNIPHPHQNATHPPQTSTHSHHPQNSLHHPHPFQNSPYAFQNSTQLNSGQAHSHPRPVHPHQTFPGSRPPSQNQAHPHPHQQNQTHPHPPHTILVPRMATQPGATPPHSQYPHPHHTLPPQPPAPRPHNPSHHRPPLPQPPANVDDQGEYRVGIKFNDKHIPDSPYKVYITPSMGEARKVEVAQFPDQGGPPNKPQGLLVCKNGANGHLDCKFTAPSGQEEDCFTDLLDNDLYSVRFVPKEIGIHNIHVKFNGIHIPGSPFRLRIGKDEADPAAVSVTGKGIESCVSGHKTDFIVDTCNAGAGTLAVTIDGPSKVSMDCTEVEEGYKVRYTPLVAGDYYIAVKYNSYHVVGSPWKVKCTGEAHAEKSTVQESSSVVVETVEKSKSGEKGHHGTIIPRFHSDASKVSSKGLGLKKAHINRQNNFTVNASTAGNNILYVGVYGPKAPCEEVYIKHVGHHNYQISYMVREKGDYILMVKWGDDHIPGSPFHVTV